MVSFIESSFYESNEYANMPLSEACYEASIQLNEAVNDLYTSTLLDEHAFLIENGYEIDYVNEADKESFGDKLGKLKDKIVRVIKIWWKKVCELFDRFIQWVGARVTSLVAKIGAGGKNNFEKNASKLDNAEWNKIVLKNVAYYPANAGEAKTMFDISASKDYVQKLKDFNPNVHNKSKEDIFNELMIHMGDEKADNQKRVTAYSDKSVKDGIFNAYSVYKSVIAKNRKEINKKLSDSVKDLGNKKNAAELTDAYTGALKNNMNVVHGYIKAWTTYTNECAKVARAMVKDARVAERDEKRIKKNQQSVMDAKRKQAQHGM